MLIRFENFSFIAQQENDSAESDDGTKGRDPRE
jgi:hypothetical protein